MGPIYDDKEGGEEKKRRDRRLGGERSKVRQAETNSVVVGKGCVCVCVCMCVCERERESERVTCGRTHTGTYRVFR